jgi:hypothetical protein
MRGGSNNRLQLLKKNDNSVATLKKLNSFVANNRQGVQFNTQFVDKKRQTID